MSYYSAEIRRASIIVSGFAIWVMYALLIAAVKMELLNDFGLFLVFLWILAVVCALRVVLYLSIPREERDIYEFRRPFRLFVEAYIFDLGSTWDRFHNLITFFVHPYTETGLFVYIIVRFLLALKRLH